MKAINEFIVHATYYCSTCASVELPEGKTTEDIKEWWIKWGVFHCELMDGSRFEKDMGVEIEPDTKRPTEVSIYGVNDDGSTNYDHDLSEELGVP
jgi:hypothetical protein